MEARGEHIVFLTLCVPVALAFGVWMGWGTARRFHLRLERHNVKLSEWLKPDSAFLKGQDAER